MNLLHLGAENLNRISFLNNRGCGCKQLNANVIGEYDVLLDEMKEMADPEADRLMSDIAAAGGNVFAFRQMTSDPRLRDFMETHSKLPLWVDLEKIERGQNLFYRYGMTIVTLLFFSALPQGYACRNPARILVETGKMADGREILARILRTAQFLIDVMQPAGLRPAGRGVQGALEIRLLHAAVRTRLQDRDFAAGQVIINQEELAGTLGTFSVLMLEGMRGFEIDFTPEEEQAYVHVWNVVGYLMGVDERLLPSCPEAATQQFNAVKSRIQAPSEHGRELTQALLNFLHEMIPGEALDGFADTLMRHTIGEPLANALSIPRCDWTDCFLPILQRLNCWTDEAGDESQTVRKGLEKLQSKIIEGLMGYYSSEAVQVKVPRTLQSQWGLISEPA